MEQVFTSDDGAGTTLTLTAISDRNGTFMYTIATTGDPDEDVCEPNRPGNYIMGADTDHKVVDLTFDNAHGGAFGRRKWSGVSLDFAAMKFTDPEEEE